MKNILKSFVIGVLGLIGFTACKDDFLNELETENNGYGSFATSNWEFDWVESGPNQTSWEEFIGGNDPQRYASSAVNDKGDVLVLYYENNTPFLKPGKMNVSENENDKGEFDIDIDWGQKTQLRSSISERVANGLALNNNGQFLVTYNGNVGGRAWSLVGRSGTINNKNIDITNPFLIFKAHYKNNPISIIPSEYGYFNQGSGIAISDEGHIVLVSTEIRSRTSDIIFGAYGRFKGNGKETEWVGRNSLDRDWITQPTGLSNDSRRIGQWSIKGHVGLSRKGKNFARIAMLPRGSSYHVLMITVDNSKDEGEYIKGEIRFNESSPNSDENKILWIDSDGLFTENAARDENSNTFAGNGITYASGNISVSQGLDGKNYVLISYDNTNKKGRLLESEWDLNQPELNWRDRPNSYIPIEVRGGIQRIHTTSVPGTLFNDGTPRAMLVYHTDNKDHNETENKIKYNFWKFNSF